MRTSFLLFAPGLMNSARLARSSGVEIPRLSNLETCLAKGNLERIQRDLYAALTDSLDTGAEVKLPAEAQACHVADLGDASAGWSCRADPVHLQPVGDHLQLFDDQILAVKLEEAQSLVATFNTIYERDGLVLECGAPARWYLNSLTALDVAVVSPDKVHGRSVLDFMSEGCAAAAGRRLMNEIQMIFHEHEVNRLREESGNPAINSVWLWGGGRPPASAEVELPAAWTNQACFRGLWAWAGAQVSPLPSSLEPCLADPGQGARLAVLDDLGVSLRSVGTAAWTEALRSLDEHWCKPLLEALRAGRIAEFRLISDGVSVLMRRAFQRRWWRRSRVLADLPR